MNSKKDVKEIVVCVTGASGAIYAKRLLEELKKDESVITSLVVSKMGISTIKYELNMDIHDFYKLADNVYNEDDFYAPIASGSHKFDSAVVVPCSMKSVSAVANGYADNLIARVCDICLKEHRKLVLITRETPLNAIHLENMTKLAKLGVVIMPPVPAFYSFPKTVDDIIYFTVGRILDNLRIKNNLVKRWGDE
ncbi:UbiX family flavin prenyltransferase [Methanococcus voltae]|uniref:Flavin prenyltransferase UbiX n=1 Tax=Methanococcus voltae TaxID=2188 RepID=A0A8J7UU08_METVO|nr:UbiX family flavin prenyltransferase [Methanococcus voltae]MBP2172192.1 4-hydroxy-3-polyprenylbenzoate decarboxylase [Methanococcus voltae]MBP2200851.1 4-hydroxy-3-polyprenylbenzoate decarboxylase [Methanococcus voltae]